MTGLNRRSGVGVAGRESGCSVCWQWRTNVDGEVMASLGFGGGCWNGPGWGIDGDGDGGCNWKTGGGTSTAFCLPSSGIVLVFSPLKTEFLLRRCSMYLFLIWQDARDSWPCTRDLPKMGDGVCVVGV